METLEQQYKYALEGMRARQRLEDENAEQQQGSEQSKMGWGIFLSSLVLSLIADIAELTGVGIILTFVIDIILGFTLGFSVGARKQWKKWIAGFLPIPLVRVVLLVWSFVSSRSELLAKAQKGLALASKIPSPISAELKAASRVANLAAATQNTGTK